MTGPLARTPRPPWSSMLSVIRDRLAGSGWQHRRDPLMGREEWMEPALPAGQREPRSVLVDELFRGASGFVVEGCNGYERLLLRCVPDTDPGIVLVTLDVWRILPDQATTTRPPGKEAPASATEHGRAFVTGVACICGETFDGDDGRDPETAMTLLDQHLAAERPAEPAEAVTAGA